MAEKVFELTLNGINELKEELENRKTTISEQIAERLKEARSLGDLSENSEYDDAKEAQAANEGRIAEIEAILKNAKVIDDSDISVTEVSLGSQVKLLDVEMDEEEKYILVGASEENLSAGKLSGESPVGAAIMGHRKGDTVDVKTPAGILQYKILQIERPKAAKK